MAKIRADQRCLALGLAPSRSAALNLIRMGLIALPDGTPLAKAGQMISEDTVLQRLTDFPYVSRAAGKLLPAIEKHHPPIDNAVALDVGASTGGFTQVLLEKGAAMVYAVDVGHGQLHESLRHDPRVVSLEGVNAKELSKALIPRPIDILVADVSFISLTKVLPACAPLLADNAWIMVLIKPQFEAGPADVGKGGVVRDEIVRARCVRHVVDFAVDHFGWRHGDTLPSPVPGPDGNREFVAVFTKGDSEI